MLVNEADDPVHADRLAGRSRAGLRQPRPSWRARACAREHASGIRHRAQDWRDDARARSRDDQGRCPGRQPRPPTQSGSHTWRRIAGRTRMTNPYDVDLDRNPANFQPLTPLTFLERAAAVYPKHTAIIHGPLRRSYAEFYARARKLASALAQHRIKRGDTVSVMLANTPEMLEAHYGVPMTQGVLNTLNTRLDAAIIAFSLDHAETKVLITDREFSKTVKEALSLCKAKPLVIDYDDPEYTGSGERLGEIEYEAFVAQGDENFAWKMPDDEWDAIALNYTSGTTGDPKGVVYHYRGAHLLALGNVVTCGMGKHPVYLWTLPMFHCNG